MLSDETLLHVMGNLSLSGNALVREGLRVLLRRLPPDWAIEFPTRACSRSDGRACARISAPDGRSTLVAIEARQRLTPRDTLALLATLGEESTRLPVLLVARYLSPATRQRLREANVSFVDLTSNVRVALRKPGVFIEAAGADVDPDREGRPARTLSGPKAGRVVRELLDFRQPPGVRDLAQRVGIDAGYASRVLKLLSTEALIEQGPRGRIQRVEWPRLLRRWAEEAPFDSRGGATAFLEPRGLAELVGLLATTKEQYALTGSFAASKIAPIAAPRLATLYVDDAVSFADGLGLRPVEAGANVVLVQPVDHGVFVRSSQTDGVRYAAPSQVAADLLTSTGRGPAEAEALIAWMTTHEEAWRG
jgi:hypothetical protein